MPLFLLLAPLAGHFLSQCRPATAWIVAAAMLLQAGPDALYAESRPLIRAGETSIVSVFRLSRDRLYFTQNTELFRPYLGGLAALDSLNVRQLGLIVGGGDPFEYPIWAMPPQGGPVTIRHVNVTNGSAGLREPSDGPPPDAVLVLGASQASEIVVGEAIFLPYFREKNCQVFLPAERIETLKQAAVTKPDLKGENQKSPK